jgi:AAA family ATP:ADP antiporter
MQVSLLWLGIAFFLWVGIFNLMVVAQFWSFANDLYTPQAGKRLFVIVAFGASAGAVFGSFAAGRLIEPLGINQLLLVAGALLLASLALTNVVDARSRRTGAGPETASAAEVEKPMPKGGAFQLVMKSRYLLLIALLMLFLNWVNTTGEYILGRTVTDAAAKAVAAGATEGLSLGEYIGKFYADFFTIVNLVGLLMQLFIVSRVLKYLGVRIALMALPVIALGGYFIIAFYPVLMAVRWVKTAENATDYSLQNTVRQVLFLPTTREEKYKAKQAIDTFFWRAGDVLSAILVGVVTTWLAFQTKHFAIFNMALVCVWIALAVLIGRHHRRLTAERAEGGARSS